MTKNNFDSSLSDEVADTKKKEIHRVVATIMDNEYVLKAEDSEEHLLGIAAMVDNKMLELRRKYPRTSLNRLAILTALQFADDFVKISDQYDRILKELD